MFRCFNCGNVFEEPLTIKTEQGKLTGCPRCGIDDMAKGDICPDCGHFFEDKDLHAGLCSDCLRERIDYPTGLSYLLDWDFLRDFLETVDGDYAKTADLHALLMSFLIHETEDRNWGRETFLEALRDYIMDDPISVGDFASWMEEEA